MLLGVESVGAVFDVDQGEVYFKKHDFTLELGSSKKQDVFVAHTTSVLSLPPTHEMSINVQVPEQCSDKATTRWANWRSTWL